VVLGLCLSKEMALVVALGLKRILRMEAVMEKSI